MIFPSPKGNYILIQVIEDLNCDTVFTFILGGTCVLCGMIYSECPIQIQWCW